MAVLVAACGGSSTTVTTVEIVDSLALSPSTASVEVGLTLQFQATAFAANGTPLPGAAVTWASSVPGVATVDASTGLATGVAVGTTEIRATADSVTATRTLAVTPLPCTVPTPVTLSPGEHVTVAGDTCLLLPAGAAGDIYRVAVGRPNVIADASNTPTVALAVSPVLSAAAAGPDRGGSPARVLRPDDGLALLDGARVLERLEAMDATRAFHMALRLRERQLGLDPSRALPDRTGPAGAPPLRVDPPATRLLKLDLSCATSNPQEVRLIAFDDDLAIYQQSSEWSVSPVSPAAAQQLLDYYAAYVKDMLRAYWGNIPDTDGNARILVVTTPALDEGVAAAVFSGDYYPTSAGCPGSNEGEVIYFQRDVIAALDAADPNSYALGVLAHEAKHVVSLYNSILRGSSTPEFNDLWIEEGTAEISQVMSSRIAWAATGGPAVDEVVTATNVLAAVQANGGRETPEMTGVIDALAGVARSLSAQPNSLITDPVGAPPEHSFYSTSWHWHRFLGDAFGNASSAPLADSSFFRMITSPLTPAGGASGEIQVTGRGSFEQLFEDFVVAVSLHGSGFTPTYAIDTWDLVSATSIFRTPNPDGNYPWPVTATEVRDASGRTTSVTQWAPFTSNVYTSTVGPSGVRFHDFRSSGTAAAQIYVAGAENGIIVVTRLD